MELDIDFCPGDGQTVTLANQKPCELARLYHESCPEDRRVSDFPYGLTDGFALAQLDWLEAIKNGGQPETSGREGLMDLACSLAVLESSLAQRRVGIDEILDGSVSAYQDQFLGMNSGG